MIHQIKTMDNVKTFLEQIASEIDDFSPYADFASYVYRNTHQMRYTDEEAAIRNTNLEMCFTVCENCAEGSLEFIEWYYDLKRLCVEHEGA